METKQLKSELILKMKNPSLLIGSASGFAFLSRGWENLLRNHESEKNASFSYLIQEISVMVQRRTSRLKNRLVSQFLRKGIPSSVADSLEDIPGAANNGMVLNERVKYLFNIRLTSYGNSSHFAFRGIQYVTYLFIFFILLISLAGEGAWHRLFEYPGWASGLNFAVTAMYALFTPAVLRHWGVMC